MSEVVAVLVVTKRGGHLNLLAPGPCGARPPRVVSGHVCAYESHREWQTDEDGPRDCYMCRHPLEALPLWWDGALVPEGWDRAARCVSWNDSGCHVFEIGEARLACVLDGARALVRHGKASRVVLLTRDADGRLVEVSP